MKIEEYEELLSELHARKSISNQQFIDLLQNGQEIVEATNKRIELVKQALGEDNENL